MGNIRATLLHFLFKNMMLGEGVETEKLGSKGDKKARKITSQLQAKMIVGLVSILKQVSKLSKSVNTSRTSPCFKGLA